METPLSSIADIVRSRPTSLISNSSRSSSDPFQDLAPSRAPTTVAFQESFVDVVGIPHGRVRLGVDSKPGCGGVVWPSGGVLARYLAYRHEQDPTYLQNRNILELGSGTGLVGIAVGLLQPEAQVWVTDQACLLDLMQRNIDLNLPDQSTPSPNVHVAELNWGEPLPQSISGGEFDLILAADCVYFEPAFPLLVQTLCDLVPFVPQGERAVEVLFCWKKRRNADKHFFNMLKKHFTYVSVDDDRVGEREKYNREGITLLRLTRKN